MIGETASLARVWALFRDPVTTEKRMLLEHRWSSLDPSLKLPGQGLGQKATGCGATMGIQPKCDFSCTGCYLGTEANKIPALPVEAVLRQLDSLRAWLGPPIFIDGKVVGALAYAWQFAKEPVAGITPIDEMLKLSQRVAPAGASPAGAAPRMTAIEMLSSFAKSQPAIAFDKLMANNATPVSSISGAKRIALPMSLGSFSADTVQRFTPQLEQLGFVAVPAGAASSSTTKSSKTSFALGDPIGAVLLSGDFNVAASGTVSYVDGKNIYAFGHPFLDMGEINFPMATSEVVTVMPSVASSFKFSNTGDIVGVLRQDRAAGIMGVLGDKPEMIPVEVT
ncbi:MAG TPA: hypothetical protein VE010_07015, partial [Thermoanaerobaculia bacterium]|nr:hypothetical protein [Thermoanaerobaculia bacterium]